MSRVRAARAGLEVFPAEPADFGGGGPIGTAEPPVSNAKLAIVLFIGAEVMLFLGMTGAFVLYRTSSAAWPPPGQPMLPIAVTFLNTLVLLASVWTMRRAYAALREDDQAGLRLNLAITAALGVTFLLVQGYEWTNLVRHGMTLQSSTYGATFYTLIGLHAAHVAGAVLWLVTVLALAFAGRYSKRNHVGVQVCSIYWGFVCGLWVVLFGLVYVA